MACNYKSYCFKYRVFVIIKIMWLGFLSIPSSGEITVMVEDRSYSHFCETGLLENRDNIALDIRINMKGVPENDANGFVLEARDPVDNYTITVCTVNFKIHCSAIMLTRGCLCERQGDTYHIAASSAADIRFQNFVIKVNGKQLKNVHSKEVYPLKPEVSLKVSGRKVQMKRNCQVYAPSETDVLFKLCVTGLNTPTLSMSFHGVNHTEPAKCISADFQTASASENVHIRFQDKCQRDVHLSCTVQGTNDDSSEFPYYDDESENTWRTVFLVCILLLATSGLLFIFIKIKQMYEPEPLTPQDGLSSVDPEIKASSSLKKFAERMSLKNIAPSNVWVNKSPLQDAGNTEV